MSLCYNIKAIVIEKPSCNNLMVIGCSQVILAVGDLEMVCPSGDHPWLSLNDFSWTQSYDHSQHSVNQRRLDFLLLDFRH